MTGDAGVWDAIAVIPGRAGLGEQLAIGRAAIMLGNGWPYEAWIVFGGLVTDRGLIAHAWVETDIPEEGGIVAFDETMMPDQHGMMASRLYGTGLYEPMKRISIRDVDLRTIHGEWAEVYYSIERDPEAVAS